MHNWCKCGQVYGEGDNLLLRDCYKTVQLYNVCSANVQHCRSFPAHVYFACRTRQAVSLTTHKTTASRNTASWHDSNLDLREI